MPSKRTARHRLAGAGTERVGAYTLLHRLAAGGMAEVFLARRDGDERVVVVKRILPHLEGDAQFLQMFLDEARLAAQLHHPNIVSVLELGGAAAGRGYFLAMELVDGQSLYATVARAARQGRALSPGPCVQLVAKACAGVHHAHEARDARGVPLHIVHRDLCPQNLLVTYDGQVKVVDFGIAKADPYRNRTEAGQIKGKYAYMAPERFLSQPADRRVDVWSLGVTLFWLLTKQRPFPGPGQLEVMRQVVEDELPPLRCDGEPLPEGLEALVRTALEKDPARRFQTADAFGLALEGWLGGQAEPVTQAVLAGFMEDLFPQASDPDRVLKRRLARATLRHRTAEVASASPRRETLQEGGQLPVEGKGFVGRALELWKLREHLAGGGRLATVVGPAGIGKTRLAVHLGTSEADRYSGGARFVDLTQARSEEAFHEALAAALGLRLDEGRPAAAQLAERLQPAGRLLLILDGFEPPSPAAARWLEPLIAQVPGLCCLATSRAALDLAGERVFELPPLALSGGTATAAGAGGEAAQLFVERAQAVRPGLALGPRELQAVSEIVRHLEGIPLAIELAAARVGSGLPQDLLPRLAERLRLLAPAPVGGAQPSAVRGALEWTWDLLPPDERTALAQCALFRGGFSAAAATAVLRFSIPGCAAYPRQPVAGAWSRSRCSARSGLNGELRFGLAVSVREFAEQKLGRHLRRARRRATPVQLPAGAGSRGGQRERVGAVGLAVARAGEPARASPARGRHPGRGPSAARGALGARPDRIFASRGPLQRYLARCWTPSPLPGGGRAGRASVVRAGPAHPREDSARARRGSGEPGERAGRAGGGGGTGRPRAAGPRPRSALLLLPGCLGSAGSAGACAVGAAAAP